MGRSHLCELQYMRANFQQLGFFYPNCWKFECDWLKPATGAAWEDRIRGTVFIHAERRWWDERNAGAGVKILRKIKRDYIRFEYIRPGLLSLQLRGKIAG